MKYALELSSSMAADLLYKAIGDIQINDKVMIDTRRDMRLL